VKSSKAQSALPTTSDVPRRRGRKPRPVVEFPAPRFTHWDEPDSFGDALALHMMRHGDTDHHLRRALVAAGTTIDQTTLRSWRFGRKIPKCSNSLRVLNALERRYRLPNAYFQSRLPATAKATTISGRMGDISSSERRRLAWHLPDNFDALPVGRREEILSWVRSVILSGATEYRRYQAAMSRHPFAIRFACAEDPTDVSSVLLANGESVEARGPLDACQTLDRQMAELIAFKTTTLTERGVRRTGVWGPETASQKIEHLGLLFGALAADPQGEVRGLGAAIEELSLGQLAFPGVWDWYLKWREGRRGFFTHWEFDMLSLGAALTRRETGWLRQSPRVASELRPLPGLVSNDEIALAKHDWDRLNDETHLHLVHRAREIQRVARVHRDPFEPILVILESTDPLGAYRKITDEVLLRRPDPSRYPIQAAENCRTFLLLRLGLHLGVRQKNLRQLLFCARDRPATPERKLELLKRGELRWSLQEQAWEVLIPSVAFKNAKSSYFGRQPFRLVLPDLAGLYEQIDSYVRLHRQKLLGRSPDPGTFFIKTTKRSSQSAEYDQNTFYEAWRLAIQRYGVFNPYTRRGAIQGLLPHGPHSLRDVLATHILKKTGSYEQASYAIQDTPDTVAKHYGRFLPKDKAALAARVLNQAWSS
jgi:hypothetical protein